MRFEDLQLGDVFTIDGAPYEAAIIGQRVVVAYVLEETGELHGHSVLQRIPDPNDLAGDQCLTTAFSDLRFNLNNLTAFERQCDEDLKALL